MEVVTQLFLKVFNMSVAASWLVMAVMIMINGNLMLREVK